MKRTQLNVSIDPNLLQKIKENAKRSGKTLNRYVSDCCTNQLEIFPSETIESRFNNIEERLKCFEKSLLLITNKSKKPKSFTSQEVKNFNEFIKAIFRKQVKRKHYSSSKEAWNDLINHLSCFDQWNDMCSFRLKEALFFEEGDPLSSDEINFLQAGDTCPSPIRTGIINWINDSTKGQCCCSYKDFPSQKTICQKGSILVKDL